MKTLKEVYQKHWNDYLVNIRRNCSVEPANPFLIFEPQDYYCKSKKVMICGQETQGWGNEFDTSPESATIEALQQLYDNFVNVGGYNSPYWQFVNSLKKACTNVSFVCNNIVKIGKKYGAGCDDRLNELSLKYFPVLREEIVVLKPDVILFLTGPNYDWRIRNALGNFNFNPVGGINKLVRISFCDTSLPVAYRCYHPRYLRVSKQENIVRSFFIENVLK